MNDIIQTIQQIQSLSLTEFDFQQNRTAIQELYTYLVELFKGMGNNGGSDSGAVGFDYLFQLILQHKLDVDNPHQTNYIQLGFNVYTDDNNVQQLQLLDNSTPPNVIFDSALVGITEDELNTIQNQISNLTYLDVSFSNVYDTDGITITGLEVLLSDGTTLNLSDSNYDITQDPNFIELSDIVDTNTTNISTIQTQLTDLNFGQNDEWLTYNDENGNNQQVANQTDLTNVENTLGIQISQNSSNLSAHEVDPNAHNLGSFMGFTPLSLPISTAVQNALSLLASGLNPDGSQTPEVENIMSLLANLQTAINNNADSIHFNTQAIQSNVSSISDNLQLINALTNRVTTNESNITTNQTNISTNTTNIQNNANDISLLQATVSALTGMNYAGPYPDTSTISIPNPQSNIIYLIGTSSPYSMYLWIDNAWVNIGSMNASNNLVTQSDLANAVNQFNTAMSALQQTVNTNQSNIYILTVALNNHINATGNVHGLTTADLNLENVVNLDTSNYNNITKGQIQSTTFLPNVTQSVGNTAGNVSEWLGVNAITTNNILANGNGILGVPNTSPFGNPTFLTPDQIWTILGNVPTANLPTTTNINVSSIVGSETANRILRTGTANTAPSWSQIDATTDILNRIPLNNMPTSATANRVLLVGGTANANPTYGQVALNSMVAGALPLANGGTGQTSLRNSGWTIQSRTAVGSMNLNTLVEPAVYYFTTANGNTATNKPRTVGNVGFILEVFPSVNNATETTGDHIVQRLTNRVTNVVYVRNKTSSTAWNAWRSDCFQTGVVGSVNINPLIGVNTSGTAFTGDIFRLIIIGNCAEMSIQSVNGNFSGLSQIGSTVHGFRFTSNITVNLFPTFTISQILDARFVLNGSGIMGNSSISNCWNNNVYLDNAGSIANGINTIHIRAILTNIIL